MKEKEIRPKDIFNKYLRLAKQDCYDIFKDSKKIKLKCYACNGNSKKLFSKYGFNYCECINCKTIFVNPRPKEKYFRDFYLNGKSVKYWSTTFYKKTAKSRKEKLWKRKAEIILKKLDKNIEIVDIGGGYGLFAEVVREISNNPITIIEPNKELASICKQKGFNVIEKFIEDVKNSDLSDKKKCFLNFELFEHLFDPKDMVKKLYQIMKKGDLFCFTTLSGLGFDIQMLKENSKSIFPPHHLNFFNPDSVKLMLKKIGFKNINVETPGQLDVDIVLNDLKNCKDQFMKNFIYKLDEKQIIEFQKMLVKSKLSSHMWTWSNK